MLSYTYAKSIDQGSDIGERLNPIDARQSRAISAWDLKHTFVASFSVALPLDRIHHGPAALPMTGESPVSPALLPTFPVTLFDNSDNSLLGTLGNGANNYLLDTPQYIPGPLKINTNGHNGRPAFDTSLFPEENLGQLGNSKRRMFYGPGIDNFDLTLQKGVPLGETRSLDLRLESFNTFNHGQFYGPAAVVGQIEDPSFGSIDSAAAPRLVQLAAKFSF